MPGEAGTDDEAEPASAGVTGAAAAAGAVVATAATDGDDEADDLWSQPPNEPPDRGATAAQPATRLGSATAVGLRVRRGLGGVGRIGGRPRCGVQQQVAR